MTAPGTPILPADDFSVRVPNDALDPEQAILRVLKAYLLTLTFREARRAGPKPMKPVRFGFSDVFEDWPDPNRDLPYPCASLAMPSGKYEAHSLTPTPIEESYGIYDGAKGTGSTMLWKLSALSQPVQLSCWVTDKASQEAIAARIPGAFAPGSVAGRVLLTGDPLYWCLPVRASLVEHDKIEEAEALYANERRMDFMLQVNVDVVELRCANLLSVRTHLTIGEMVEIAESGE